MYPDDYSENDIPTLPEPPSRLEVAWLRLWLFGKRPIKGVGLQVAIAVSLVVLLILAAYLLGFDKHTAAGP